MTNRADTQDAESLLRLREMYDVERELADRLRVATPAERRTLYGTVYDEYYRRVPWLSYLNHSSKETGTEAWPTAQFTFLQRFLTPETVFLEVGPGDCMLAREVCRHVRHVYAVDVSDEVMKSAGELPPNVETIVSDGSSIPVQPASVDVVYSHHLMEHLHPDDAFEQLRNVHDVLKPGGKYICITPNGTNGPHDVSKHFGDPVATGFHLKEYTVTELQSLFKDVGLRNVKSYVMLKRRAIPIPPLLIMGVEQVVRHLPRWLWDRMKRSRLPMAVLLIRLVGTR